MFAALTVLAAFAFAMVHTPRCMRVGRHADPSYHGW